MLHIHYGLVGGSDPQSCQSLCQGKRELEGFVSAIKCSSLQMTCITFVQNSLARLSHAAPPNYGGARMSSQLCAQNRENQDCLVSSKTEEHAHCFVVFDLSYILEIRKVFRTVSVL